MAGGGDAGPKPDVPWYYGFTAFLAFAVGNASLNYLNSWVMHASPTGVPGIGKVRPELSSVPSTGPY